MVEFRWVALPMNSTQLSMKKQNTHTLATTLMQKPSVNGKLSVWLTQTNTSRTRRILFPFDSVYICNNKFVSFYSVSRQRQRSLSAENNQFSLDLDFTYIRILIRVVQNTFTNILLINHFLLFHF